MVFIFLKAIHLLALLFGSAASLGNLYILMAKGPHDLPAPGFIKQLRFFFRITAMAAISLLWVSGVMLMLVRYGWWIDGFAFDVKIAFATLLLVLITFINLWSWRATPTNAPPSWMPVLHFIGVVSLILTTLFAVVSFN